jgi:hypothetical protein
MNHTVTRTAAVALNQQWSLIDSDTPRGVKIQLISKQAGVATYGSLGSKNDHFTHWAPLPAWEHKT